METNEAEGKPAVRSERLLGRLVISRRDAKRFHGHQTRVEMTYLGKREKLDGPRHRRTGTIIGETRDGSCWRIRRDGEKSVRVYHKSFWRSEGVIQRPNK